MAFSMHCISPR